MHGAFSPFLIPHSSFLYILPPPLVGLASKGADLQNQNSVTSANSSVYEQRREGFSLSSRRPNSEKHQNLTILSKHRHEGFSNKRQRLFYGLLSLVTLLAGIVIYFLFRDLNNIVLFKWIPQPELLKTILIALKPSISANFLRYYLPDTLWFISAILFLRFLWFYKVKTQTSYIVSFYAIGLVLEISQLSENIPGTFDWFDLLFMGIGAFIESLLYKIFTTRRLT